MGLDERYRASVSRLNLQKVSLELGGRSIFENLDLRVEGQEKVGLVGPNGSGKSTLLRLLANEVRPDAGQVSRREGLRIGYLPQDWLVSDRSAILDFVLKSVPGKDELEQSASAREARLASLDSTADAAEWMEAAQELADLQERLQAFDEEFSPHRAKAILQGLGFHTEEMTRSLQELSGGWKMRALLAALLFQRPDLLLLDEPTNHLDIPTVAWLGRFLRHYRQAFVLVSHDRDFLNDPIDTVWSFEEGRIRVFKGNYDAYLKQCASEEELLRRRAENLARERERTLQFIERFRAKASKAAAVQSRIRQLEKQEVPVLPGEKQALAFSFPPSPRSGQRMLEVRGLDKGYGDFAIFRGVDLHVQRGERIAVLGANGTGKSTLLRLLAKALDPDAGEVVWGHQVKVGYFAQEHVDVLPMEKSVLEVACEGAAHLGISQIRGLLAAIGLGADHLEKRIGVLSGGERARSALARLLVDPGNLLILDEPTNHLDLEASEALAEALATFDGTLIFASHHRAFIRRLADQLWVIEEGKVRRYPRSLDELLEELANPGDASESETGGQGAAKDKSSRAIAGRKAKRQEAAERRRKLEPLRKASKSLETRIETLEAEQMERNEALSSPELYQDAERRREMLEAFGRAAQELDSAMEEWTRLQEELDRLEAELDEVQEESA
mgnify:CR=1 FL=1